MAFVNGQKVHLVSDTGMFCFRANESRMTVEDVGNCVFDCGLVYLSDLNGMTSTAIPRRSVL
jgi:hypothetical protein